MLKKVRTRLKPEEAEYLGFKITEISEFFLFSVDIIEKKETVKAAIKFLQKKKKDILDEVRYLEKIAPLYYKNN